MQFWLFHYYYFYYYHILTLFFQQEWIVISSQNTHLQSLNIHSSAQLHATCGLCWAVGYFYSFSQSHHLMAPKESPPGDEPPKCVRFLQNEHRNQGNMARAIFNHLFMHRCRAARTVIPGCPRVDLGNILFETKISRQHSRPFPFGT